MTMLNTPEQIHHFRYLTLLSALKLEIKGIRAIKGQSAYSIIKHEWQMHGNKIAVYNQLAEILGKDKIEA